jgi:hypothetical protein
VYEYEKLKPVKVISRRGRREKGKLKKKSQQFSLSLDVRF